ncbi:hypothetical protein HO173_013179 [Letharia columbiana]|uniref:Uncharacterized protein n=1 Tax=Letharia columbiana TaxID=112416 RepID=A0A8H6CHZ8_9LECA|nr:uncharacterized protein HO173_013179 [Letharia columbiana]KAF6223847.1 hypothetical protein HO173_013179 [Letharia columbiana]
MEQQTLALRAMVDEHDSLKEFDCGRGLVSDTTISPSNLLISSSTSAVQLKPVMHSLTLVSSILLALSAGTLAQNTSASNKASNMIITVSDGLNCNQNGTGINFTTPLLYNVQTTNFDNNSMQILSYSLSRATTLQEQLDFSGPTRGMGTVNGDPEQCTLFHETTSPNSNGNTLVANQCYGLLLGPAECLRFFVHS